MRKGTALLPPLQALALALAHCVLRHQPPAAVARAMAPNGPAWRARGTTVRGAHYQRYLHRLKAVEQDAASRHNRGFV